MDASFWRERWSQGQTSFHRGEVNPLLAQHGGTLGVPDGATAFVPLCGKSLDMGWLRSQRHPITGVEVSDIAVEQFFADSGFARSVRRQADFDVSEGGGISAKSLEDVGAVYDRAAFVALPADWRRRYARHMCDVLPSNASILMIAFEYQAPDFSGPRFSIPEQEVREL